MCARPLCCLAAFACLLIAGAPRAGAELVGLSSTEPGVLYSIDAATGAAVPVVSLQGFFVSFTGIDFMNGELYASDLMVGAPSGSWLLGKVDVSTGAVTYVNDQDGSVNWHGLAADDVSDVLYTIDLNDGRKLKSTDAAGNVSTIGGGTGIDGRGMAFDPNTGTLYATGADDDFSLSLYTVDTSTGTSSLVGALGISNYYVGLAYDPVGQILYANTGSSGFAGDARLFTVSTSTGAATLVGLNDPFAQRNIDGLAWRGSAPVPEPTALAFIAAAVCPALVLRRRRR